MRTKSYKYRLKLLLLILIVFVSLDVENLMLSKRNTLMKKIYLTKLKKHI